MSDSGRVRAQFVAFLEAAEAGSEAALQSLRAFVAESDEAAELLCEDDALAVRFALVRSSRPPLSVGCRAAVPSPLAMRRGPRLVVLALHRGHFGSISLRSRATARVPPRSPRMWDRGGRDPARAGELKNLGGFGGMGLVAGVRCSFRGEDARSADSGAFGAPYG